MPALMFFGRTVMLTKDVPPSADQVGKIPGITSRRFFDQHAAMATASPVIPAAFDNLPRSLWDQPTAARSLRAGGVIGWLR